jgi:hypothetical protein
LLVLLPCLLVFLPCLLVFLPWHHAHSTK